jgi:hypothetical protein
VKAAMGWVGVLIRWRDEEYVLKFGGESPWKKAHWKTEKEV